MRPFQPGENLQEWLTELDVENAALEAGEGLTLRQREIRRQIDARLLQREDNYSRRLREKAEECAKQERAAHEAAVPGQAEQARWNGASDQRFDHKFWAEMGLGGPYLDERLYLKRRSEPASNRALLCDDERYRAVDLGDDAARFRRAWVRRLSANTAGQASGGVTSQTA